MPPKRKAKKKTQETLATKPTKKVTHRDIETTSSPDIIMKLGANLGTSDDKIKYLLTRLIESNPKTWKDMGLMKKDFERYGVAYVSKE